MKRFKAAIASESGSYSAVGMTYDGQQYYPQYNYDSMQIHGDMNAQYYSAYSEEQDNGKLDYISLLKYNIKVFHYLIQYMQNSMFSLVSGLVVTKALDYINFHLSNLYIYYLLKIIQKFWLVKSGGWNRHIRSVVELWQHGILKTHIRHYDVICSYIENTYDVTLAYAVYAKCRKIQHLCCLCQVRENSSRKRFANTNK